MSGRLVILPHKSWNVWNQDNREKVLRDERLNKEKEKEAKDTEAQLLREQQYQILANAAVDSSYDSSTQDRPFRLFEDLERKANEKALGVGNEEYMKEKAAVLRKQKQKEGIADWALGDGSLEYSKSLPWYLGRPNINGEVVKRPARTNDILREDPMQPFINYYEPKGNFNESKDEEIDVGEKRSRFVSEGIATSDESVSSDIKSRSKKHHKSKKEKKHKKSHRDDSKHKSEPELVNEKQEKPSKSSLSGFGTTIEELRQRRLERERMEHKREVVLTSQADIYGSAYQGIDNSSRYHQQYNPNLAKNNKLK